MKKKALMAFTLLIPLTLLCGCGGTASVPLNAYWYLSSSSASNPSGTNETLEYKVEFESAGSDAYSVEYNTGVYTTALTTEPYEVEGNGTETVYHYRTQLSISGRFTVNGTKGEWFEDSVISDVWFRTLTSRLQPLKSVKQVKCNAPTGKHASLTESSEYYEYTYTIVYNNPLTSAQVSYVQNAPVDANSNFEKKVAVKNSINFFDNEQLLFVLRGLSMESAATLSTINPLDSRVTGLTVSPTLVPITDFSFVMDGNEITANMNANVVSIGYSSSSTMAGQPQSAVYAASTSSEQSGNTYRNVLLRMSVPILQNLGKLNYTLVKATFTK